MYLVPEGTRKCKFPHLLQCRVTLLLVGYETELYHLHLKLVWAQFLFDIKLI